jgi:hypothetical protein
MNSQIIYLKKDRFCIQVDTGLFFLSIKSQNLSNLITDYLLKLGQIAKIKALPEFDFI